MNIIMAAFRHADTPTGKTEKVARSEAYTTLWYGNVSAPEFTGLQVLLHSLRQHDTRRPFVLQRFDEAEAQPPQIRNLCRTYGATVVRVPRIQTRNERCLSSLGTWMQHTRSNATYGTSTASPSVVPLGMRSIFSVFNVWRLVQFERVVWLEADQLIVKPLDSLWALELPPGAVGAAASVLDRIRGMCQIFDPFAPKAGRMGNPPRSAIHREFFNAIGYPGATPQAAGRARKYNTGVLVLQPNATVMQALLAAVASPTPYSCTDGFQTLWNKILARRIRCLHHTFNCIDVRMETILGKPRKTFSRRCLGPNESVPHILHFAAAAKPWATSNAERRNVAFNLWRAQLQDARAHTG